MKTLDMPYTTTYIVVYPDTNEYSGWDFGSIPEALVRENMEFYYWEEALEVYVHF